MPIEPKLKVRPLGSKYGPVSFRTSVFLKGLTCALYPRGLFLQLELAIDDATNNLGLTPRICTELAFTDVLFYAMTAIDYSYTKYTQLITSSISEILDPTWCEERSVPQEYRYFIVSTYDDIIEVVARDLSWGPPLSG